VYTETSLLSPTPLLRPIKERVDKAKFTVE
jgi:hypothetical protein